MTTNGRDEHELATTTLVDQVEQRAREMHEVSATVIENADRATYTSTVSVLKHLDGIAEQAILAQCAVIRALVTEAQDLDKLLLSDLARVKDVTRIALLNGEKAAALAQSMRRAIAEMRSNHAEVINVQAN